MVDKPLGAVQEHRLFKRIDFINAVQVVREDVDGVEASHWQAQCLDISMCGLLLQVPDDFPKEVGTPFEMELMLTKDVVIEMPCTLVHFELNHDNHKHAGFRFEKMTLESLSNLRRLLELNLADSDLIERELHHLIQRRSEF